VLAAATGLAGCGGSPGRTASTQRSTAAPEPPGPAFGLTEDNAQLLWSPQSPSRSGGASFQVAREQLTALHPRYLRLLIDWAALQPAADRPPALEAPVDGCARDVGPCAGYAGVREELAAIASQQRAALAEGRGGGFEVVLDLFGAPAWAARAPSGCELDSAQPFSRPITPAGIAGYKALIADLLALARREGVALSWWSPWNEPNDPVFLSPQRESCDAGARSLASGVYAQLAEAMAGELDSDGAAHHLLLGELNAFATESPHRTSVSTFVRELPASVLCLSDVWSIHAYAVTGTQSSDPVEALQAALDARGGCARQARIWVTEAGAGASHPGLPRPAGVSEERAGCARLAEQLSRWSRDPRVGAVFQYSFREDPAFPVGLLSADMSHVYPAYELWLSYARAREEGDGQAFTPPAQACA
jgi:hypothetical protein